MTQHTPGPWKLDTRAPKTVIWGADPNSKGCVALVNEIRHDSAANAALIAAAPDLLACLVEVTGDLEAAYDDGQGAMPTAISAAIHRARAAIAKAGGR